MAKNNKKKGKKPSSKLSIEEAKQLYVQALNDEYAGGGWLNEHWDGVLGGALVAGGIAAAPFTGGASLAATGAGAGMISNDINQSKQADAAEEAAKQNKQLQEKQQLDAYIAQKNNQMLSNNPQFANGGFIPNNEYTGQSHQGPNQGIPVDAQGNPSATTGNKSVGLTEGGEFNYDSFIFSDKLKPGNSKKTFADLAKSIKSKYKKRLGDDLEKQDKYARQSLEKELSRLAQKQEQLKAEKAAEIGLTDLPTGSNQPQMAAGGNVPKTPPDAAYTNLRKLYNEGVLGNISPDELETMNPLEVYNDSAMQIMLERNPSARFVYTDDPSDNTTSYGVANIGRRIGLNKHSDGNEYYDVFDERGDVIQSIPKSKKDSIMKNPSLRKLHNWSLNRKSTDPHEIPTDSLDYKDRVWKRPAKEVDRIKKEIPFRGDTLFEKGGKLPKYSMGGGLTLFEKVQNSLSSNISDASNTDFNTNPTGIFNTNNGMNGNYKGMGKQSGSTTQPFEGGSVTPAYIGAGASLAADTAKMISNYQTAKDIRGNYSPVQARTISPEDVSFAKTRSQDRARAIDARREAMRAARTSGAGNRYADLAIDLVLRGNDQLSNRLIQSEQKEDLANAQARSQANQFNASTQNRTDMFNNRQRQQLENQALALETSGRNAAINSVSQGVQSVGQAYQDRDRFSNTAQIMADNYYVMQDKDGNMIYVPKNPNTTE